MKKPKLFKRILAGSLVLTLTVLDAVPVMASEIQTSENVVEAEGDELSEDLPTEESEKEAETPETQIANPETVESEPEAEAAVPKTETGTKETETEILQGEIETIQKEALYTDVQNEKAASAEPSITQPTLTATDHSSYTIFRLSFTGTNCYMAHLEVKASDTGSIVYSRNSYEAGDSIDTDYFYDSKTDKDNLVPGVTYTFTLTPYTYVENEEGYEEEVTGAARNVIWKAPAVEVITGLAIKEMTPSGFSFSHKAVSEDTPVYYEYSSNKAFDEKLA